MGYRWTVYFWKDDSDLHIWGERCKYIISLNIIGNLRVWYHEPIKFLRSRRLVQPRGEIFRGQRAPHDAFNGEQVRPRPYAVGQVRLARSIHAKKPAALVALCEREDGRPDTADVLQDRRWPGRHQGHQAHDGGRRAEADRGRDTDRVLTKCQELTECDVEVGGCQQERKFDKL